MKTANRLICILVFCLIALSTVSCGEKTEAEQTDIVSAVDSPEGYEPLDISGHLDNEHNGVEIRHVFLNRQVSREKAVIHVVTKGGYNGSVELVFLITDLKITKIKAINITETADIGGKAFKDEYLSQFNGISLSRSAPLKGGSRPAAGTDIVFVTGATYTSSAVIKAVNGLTDWYRKNSSPIQLIQ